MNNLTKFPQLTLSENLTTSKAEINGQQVVFDKKITLFPIELKSNIRKPFKLPNHREAG